MLVVMQIPMRADNYSYGLIHKKKLIMIDPSESTGSEQFMSAHPELTLEAILCTHSHFDHIGGNEVLQKKFGCSIYGPKLERERITGITHTLESNNIFDIAGIRIIAHDVKAHTCGHIAYEICDAVDRLVKHGHNRASKEINFVTSQKIIFVGDSLFGAGCGRLFEGSVADLVRVLKFYVGLPKNMLLACAHEYTQDNLEFAQYIFPENQKIQERIAQTKILIEKDGSSIPSFVYEELETNPFLLALNPRYHEEIQQKLSIKNSSLTSLIGALRKAKDNF